MVAQEHEPLSARRRALVTGASSGIGAATARLLAAEGYAVAMLARRGAELEHVKRSLSRAHDHVATVCDLRDVDSVRAALHEIDARFGGLDLVVNNAGVGYRARVEEMDTEIARELYEINVLGLLVVCREALPLLRKGRDPVVVNVSSIVGRRGLPGQIVYASSKAAVNSISEGLRIEWARDGIAVCVIEPGLTRTPFFDVQPNPSQLENPSFAAADDPERVAREIVALDRSPRPERSLRRKWQWLAWISLIAPRLGDRLLVRNMGGGWSAPRR